MINDNTRVGNRVSDTTRNLVEDYLNRHVKTYRRVASIESATITKDWQPVRVGSFE